MQKVKQVGLLLGTVAGATLLFSACSAQQSATTTNPSSPMASAMAESPTPAASDMGMMEHGVMVGGAMMTPDKTIVANAMAANNFTTLVMALKAAGLDTTLSGAGPFTVFAPTDDAFKKIAAATLAAWMKPANKAQLVSLLKYHVVAGHYTAADLKDGQKLKTVNGATVTIKKQNGQIWVNNALVTTPDVLSSNGVTFVIDTVLMPAGH